MIGLLMPVTLWVRSLTPPASMSNVSERVLLPRIIQGPRRFEGTLSRPRRWQISVVLGTLYRERTPGYFDDIDFWGWKNESLLPTQRYVQRGDLLVCIMIDSSDHV